jgi:acyl-CoA dehydrogenase
MPFHAAVTEYDFIFKHVVNFAQVQSTDLFSEATEDLTAAILEEAGKMCTEVIAPLQRPGDLHPARLENGVVRTSPGFAEGFKAIADGGWIGMSAQPEHGGMGLPMSLTTAVNEMLSGACLSLQLAPLMSQGQIEALEHHGSDAIKDIYLPKLISGEWTGTMNLTEPQAGSMARTASAVRKSISRGAITISLPTCAIWFWRAFRARPQAPKGSACFWCQNSCPMRMAIPVNAMVSVWLALSTRWACTDHRPP